MLSRNFFIGGGILLVIVAVLSFYAGTLFSSQPVEGPDFDNYTSPSETDYENMSFQVNDSGPELKVNASIPLSSLKLFLNEDLSLVDPSILPEKHNIDAMTMYYYRCLAYTTKETAYCAKLPDSETKSSCLDKLHEYWMLKDGNQDLTPDEKTFKQAFNSQDQSMCSQINSQMWKDTCNIVTRSNKPTDCQREVDGSSVCDTWYYSRAYLDEDANYCDDIQSPWERVECHLLFGKTRDYCDDKKDVLLAHYKSITSEAMHQKSMDPCSKIKRDTEARKTCFRAVDSYVTSCVEANGTECELNS